MSRLSREKIIKKICALNDTLGQVNLIDVSKTLTPKASKDTFFTSAQETFSRTDNMMGHKTNHKYKKIKIISRILSYQNVIN